MNQTIIIEPGKYPLHTLNGVEWVVFPQPELAQAVYISAFGMIYYQVQVAG